MKHKVINAVYLAIRRASLHLTGNRDQSLPAFLDPQVERFLEILRKMKNSLENQDCERVFQKQMGFAIADGWPFESELGRLICEAEVLYHSLKEFA